VTNRFRTISALALTYMIFGVLLNSVGIVILQAIASLGVSASHASVLEAFKDLPIAFASFLVASLLPRLGYRKAMIVGLALVAAASLMMFGVGSFTSAKVLFACVGVAFALVKVSVYSSIGLLTRGAREHASLTALIEGLFMVGVLAGFWIFSGFVDARDPTSKSWLNVYPWLAAGSVAAAVLVFLSPLDETAAQSSRPSMLADFLAMLRLMWRNVVFVFVLSAFLYVLIEQGIGTWLPTFNNRVLQLPTDMSIQAASIFAACLAIGRLSAGIVLRKFPWFPVVSVCVVAMAALVLLALPLAEGIAPDPAMSWASAPLAAFVFPLIGVFLAPIYPTINSTMLSALQKRDHAAMMGLIIVFSALGGTTGSLITGQVFGRFNGLTAFYLLLLPMALLLVTLFVFEREVSRGRGAPPASTDIAAEGASGP
jgi:MFS transporter, FHS family, glucose/mannose:H+ symporter